MMSNASLRERRLSSYLLLLSMSCIPSSPSSSHICYDDTGRADWTIIDLLTDWTHGKIYFWLIANMEVLFNYDKKTKGNLLIVSKHPLSFLSINDGWNREWFRRADLIFSIVHLRRASIRFLSSERIGAFCQRWKTPYISCYLIRISIELNDTIKEKVSSRSSKVSTNS